MLTADAAPEHGFTLIEVLIAMTIASMFFVLLLPVSVSSLRRAELSAGKNRGWLLASSQLASPAVCRWPAGGSIKGMEEALSWELRISNGGHRVDAARDSGAAVSLRTAWVLVADAGTGVPLVNTSVQRVCVEP